MARTSLLAETASKPVPNIGAAGVYAEVAKWMGSTKHINDMMAVFKVRAVCRSEYFALVPLRFRGAVYLLCVCVISILTAHLDMAKSCRMFPASRVEHVFG